MCLADIISCDYWVGFDILCMWFYHTWPIFSSYVISFNFEENLRNEANCFLFFKCKHDKWGTKNSVRNIKSLITLNLSRNSISCFSVSSSNWNLIWMRMIGISHSFQFLTNCLNVFLHFVLAFVWISINILSSISVTPSFEWHVSNQIGFEVQQTLWLLKYMVWSVKKFHSRIYSSVFRELKMNSLLKL